ncbi:hypothetical protein M8C21_028029, partial [Ambrosia artemisiifolia]
MAENDDDDVELKIDPPVSDGNGGALFLRNNTVPSGIRMFVVKQNRFTIFFIRIPWKDQARTLAILVCGLTESKLESGMKREHVTSVSDRKAS